MQTIIALGPFRLIYCGLAVAILLAWLVSDTKAGRWFMRKVWGDWYDDPDNKGL